jgi:hypothetical protein
MALPKFMTEDQSLALLQTKWASLINPVIDAPQSKGLILKDVVLAAGDNTVNHRLSRKLQGWIVIGITAASQIYDLQATNQTSDKTLILNASAPCTVTLWVF